MTGSDSDRAAWDAAVADLAPAIGERAADLLAVRLLVAAGASEAADDVRSRLRSAGDDPDDPQVTEFERTLLAWADDAAADAAPPRDPRVSADLAGRLATAAGAARRLAGGR